MAIKKLSETFEADMDMLFNSNDFGLEATYHSTSGDIPVQVNFNPETERFDPYTGEVKRDLTYINAKQSDLPSAKVGDEMTILGIRYVFKSTPKSDEMGMLEIELKDFVP